MSLTRSRPKPEPTRISRSTGLGAEKERQDAECGLIDITRERNGAFELAVANAGKGDRILYHVGDYCAGAHKNAARAAYERGRVLLTMRKRDRFVFEYFAVPVFGDEV